MKKSQTIQRGIELAHTITDYLIEDDDSLREAVELIMEKMQAMTPEQVRKAIQAVLGPNQILTPEIIRVAANVLSEDLSACSDCLSELITDVYQGGLKN